MPELILYFITDYTVASIAALIVLVVYIAALVMVIRNRRTKNLHRLDTLLELTPFMAGLVPFAGLLTKIIYYYRVLAHVNARGTADPRVVSAGQAENYMNMAILCGLFFILLEAWFLLRMLYGRYIRETNVNTL